MSEDFCFFVSSPAYSVRHQQLLASLISTPFIDVLQSSCSPSIPSSLSPSLSLVRSLARSPSLFFMNVITSYFLVRSLAGTVSLSARPVPLDERTSSLSDWMVRERRQEEYLHCLWQHIHQPGVENVHLLVEGAQALYHLRYQLHHRRNEAGEPLFSAAQRQKLIPVLRQPSPPSTYAMLFDYGNRVLPGKAVMLCNADVYLSSTHCPPHSSHPVDDLVALLDHPARGSAAPIGIALTRYEVDPGKKDARSGGTPPTDRPAIESAASINYAAVAPLINEYRGSHDAFIYRSPVPHSLINAVHHPQNSYQGENIVLHEFQQHGYVMVNPSRTIRLVHQHHADVRQWYPSKDPSRYGKAPPTTLREAHAQIAERALGAVSKSP